jgi:hypothetical protein
MAVPNTAWRLRRASISTTTRQRPRGRWGTVEQHHELSVARRLADRFNAQSRPD